MPKILEKYVGFTEQNGMLMLVNYANNFIAKMVIEKLLSIERVIQWVGDFPMKELANSRPDNGEALWDHLNQIGCASLHVLPALEAKRFDSILGQIKEVRNAHIRLLLINGRTSFFSEEAGVKEVIEKMLSVGFNLQSRWNSLGTIIAARREFYEKNNHFDATQEIISGLGKIQALLLELWLILNNEQLSLEVLDQELIGHDSDLEQE